MKIDTASLFGIAPLFGNTNPPLKTCNRFRLRKRAQAKFVEYVHKRYVFYHPSGTESGDHGLRTIDDIFGDYGKTLEETGELGIGDVDLAGTSHPF